MGFFRIPGTFANYNVYYVCAPYSLRLGFA